MIQVKRDGWTPPDIMDIVRSLREKGYKQGVDFDFSYYPPSNFAGSYLWEEEATDRYVIFSFHSETLATWFSLRY